MELQLSPGPAQESFPLRQSLPFLGEQSTVEEDGHAPVSASTSQDWGTATQGGRPALGVAAGQLAGDPDLPPAGILLKL